MEKMSLYLTFGIVVLLIVCMHAAAFEPAPDAGGLNTSGPADSGSFMIPRGSNDTADRMLPSVSGDRVVWWEDASKAGDGNARYNLVLYNLSTGERTQMKENATNPRRVGFSGDYMVLVDDAPGYNDGARMTLYNIATGEEGGFTNTTLVGGNDSAASPDIEDGYVVWHGYDSRTGSSNMYSYNISGGTESRLTQYGHSTRIIGSPKKSGQSVAWWERSNAIGQDNATLYGIYLYNLSSSTSSVIIPAGNSSPVVPGIFDISHDRLVRVAPYNDYDILYLCNITSGIETVLTATLADIDACAMSDRLLVWSEGNRSSPDSRTVSGNRSNIFIRNLDAGRPIQISDSGANPDIDGNLTVWQSTAEPSGILGYRARGSPDTFYNLFSHLVLSVESVPGGANISIDNEFEGQTPLEIPIDDKGLYFLELTLEGYPVYNETLNIDESMNVNVTYNESGMWSSTITPGSPQVFIG